MIRINVLTKKLRHVLYSRKWYANPVNKSKHKIWAKHWNENNFDKKKRLARKYTQSGVSKRVQVDSRYGAGASEHFDLQFSKQDGLCAICRKPAKHRDHNHASMKLRGWLCAPCNFFLGYLKEDIESLNRAVAYLDGWSK